MQKTNHSFSLNWATPTRIKRFVIALVLCLIADKQAAMAMNSTTAAVEAEPEIVASSWEDNDDHYASVTINGREMVRLKESASTDDSVTVEDKAEDIADKLDQLVRNKKFTAEKLYPIQTKDGVVFKVEDKELFKLSATELSNSIESRPSELKTLESKSLEYGLKLANSIRESFGAKALPMSFLKLAEMTAKRGMDSVAALAAAGASVSGHFSGTASWYGPHFHGRKCSDGTIFNQEGMTAAHRSLPFGTKLLVMNRRTGDSCVVKVNDRGPFIGNRVIDLSKGAAKQLNMIGSGVTLVDCIVLGK